VVQRSSDDAAALHGRVRDFLKSLRDVVDRLAVDQQGANQRFDTMYQDFSATLADHGVLELHVSTNRISVGDSEVFRSESRTNNLAFDLFRQGIRQIKFQPEVASEELYTLVLQFSESAKIEEIDEDINTNLWRESLPHIEIVSVDIFTEKVFMADPEFVERFTQTVKDVLPGLYSFSEANELPPVDFESLVELAPFEALDQADLSERKLRKQIESQTAAIKGSFELSKERTVVADHLVQQICAMALHPECPLQDAEIRGVLSRVICVYVEDEDWSKLANVMRTLQTLSEHRVGLDPFMVSRLERIGRVAAGRDTLELIASVLPEEQTNFVSWSRWFFIAGGCLEAPQLLELINGCQNSAGKELIKSLLRRQNTSSMDAWAERLRDPNGGVVEEVIDVIVDSDLGEQAKPLFLETLHHKSPSVRARSVDVLVPFYDAQVRGSILPLITDPDAAVRRAVLGLAQRLKDKSLAPYLFQVAQADDVYSYGEDELRLLFETLALLGAPKLRVLFEERLALDQSAGVMNQLFKSRTAAIEDSAMRRAAVSGLALLGDTKSVSLVKKVHRGAELSLAAHCEVALKMAERQRARGEEEAPIVTHKESEEDLSSFAGLMGEDILFSPIDLGLNATRIVAASPAETTDSVEDAQSEAASFDQPPRASNVVRLHNEEHLYTAGERLTSNRRLSGHPSLLTGDDYRILDLQFTLVSLGQVKGPSKQTYSKTGAVEKSRTEPKKNIDDLLKSYVSVEKASNPDSVDQILQGYLDLDAEEPDAKDNKDLESLLMDYAEEDTKGSK
jgi:hypothetical protein